MKPLKYYIEQFVEPTFEDFKRNPASERHAFLACVTAYHAIDRATYPKRPRNLKNKWRRNVRSLRSLICWPIISSTS